jgi:hypothetical protein
MAGALCLGRSAHGTGPDTARRLTQVHSSCTTAGAVPHQGAQSRSYRSCSEDDVERLGSYLTSWRRLALSMAAPVLVGRPAPSSFPPSFPPRKRPAAGTGELSRKANHSPGRSATCGQHAERARRSRISHEPFAFKQRPLCPLRRGQLDGALPSHERPQIHLGLTGKRSSSHCLDSPSGTEHTGGHRRHVGLQDDRGRSLRADTQFVPLAW